MRGSDYLLILPVMKSHKRYGIWTSDDGDPVPVHRQAPDNRRPGVSSSTRHRLPRNGGLEMEDSLVGTVI